MKKMIGLLATLLAVLILPCCGGLDASTNSLPQQVAEQNSEMQPQQVVEKNSDMLPAPQLEETYPQLTITNEGFAFKPTQDEDGELYPLPFQGRPEPTAVFGAKNGLAVVACGSGPVHIAVSEDNGKNWLRSIELETGMAALEDISVGFYTMQDGWLVLADGTEAAVYTTADGGASWSLAGKTEPDMLVDKLLGSRFINRQTGWIAYSYTEGNNYDTYLLETHDGGKTWAEADAQVGTELMYGEPQLSMSLPYWDGQGWRIWATIEHTAIYQRSQLELVPQVNSGQELVWVAETKGWDLPEGISEVYFSNAIDFYRPLEYDAAKGLGAQQVGESYLLCDASKYLTRAGRQVEKEQGAVLLSAEQVNELVLYQYGDAGFDATLLEGYDPETGKLMHYEAHGGLEQYWKILEVETTPEGDIRVLHARMTLVAEDSGEFYEEEGKSECIYKPLITPDNIQVFTLLSSHVLS